MTFEARSFNDVEYHNERLTTMSWFDKIASFILSVNWSTGKGAAGGKAKTNQLSECEDNTTHRVINRQLDSHLDCVAVMSVDDTWYIAANQLSLDDSDIQTADLSMGQPLREELSHIEFGEHSATAHFHGDYRGAIYGRHTIVTDGADNMHAEMRLLKRLKSLGKMKKGLVIGVSKPCCPKCKEVLDRWEVQYTSYHDVPVPVNRWSDPEIGIPR